MAITAETRTDIIELVVGMFGGAPGASILSELADTVDAGLSLSDLAVTLGESSAFKGIYPSFLTNTEFATNYLTDLFGGNPGEVSSATFSASVDAVVSLLNAGESRGAVVYQAITAVSAVAETDTDFGNAAARLHNETEVAEYYTVTTQQSGDSLEDLQAVITDVTSSDATVATAKAAVDGTDNQGGTFTLSANADTLSPSSLTATSKTTSGNDTIYANADGAFSASDVVDGGLGTDTLYSVQDAGGADETLTPVLSNVENVFIDVNDGTKGTKATFTFNGSTTTGLKQLWVNSYNGSTAGATEDIFAITNVSTDVTTGIKGGDGNYDVTVTYSSVTGNSDSASLALSTANAETVTIAGIETLNVSTADGSSTIDNLTAANLVNLNVTGNKNVTITNSIDFKDATDTLAFDGTIDASGASGNVTLTATAGDNVKFTGGSGKNSITTGAGNDNLTGGAKDDTFTVGGGNDTVVGGAGDDRLIVSLANITASDSFDLGEGTGDTLQLGVTTLDVAGVNAAGLALVNKVSGTEVIATSGALTAIDASYFTQTIYEATANLAAAVTMTNVAGDTLKISGTGITVNGDALTVSGALPNQSFTLALANAAAVNLGADDTAAGNTGLTVASGISTVNIVNNAVSLTPADITNTIGVAATANATHSIDNASAGSFVVTGAASLTIYTGATAGFTKAVDFDASALSGKLNIVGSAEADIIKGGTNADTIDGEDGADVLTGGAGADTFVFVTTETGNAVPSSSNFETITDFAKGADIIDWSTALTVQAAATAAVAGTAQVSSEGIATFHADDDTLAERITAATAGFDSDGDFVIFEFSGDTYVYVEGAGGAAAAAATDSLIKLTGVTGITDSTIDGNSNLILA